ncbi:MAG TPA: MCE family protein [Cryomorphaceae bacterium]|nr:ABC transporter permease [Owenweeksia sp.]MBF99727.1 ABC transporter permease [Owenweeksia sp.]HAD96324.1 MCE family protein [Cryomorphaceae bacterium]HBF19209.1 MCE family protein [Cryomorphaceae bacterium]HCQ15092.1 MCE family protein [Cryomorphaceae bacterium]
MKISREFRVGLVALVALVLLYWGFNFLKGKDLFEKKRFYYAVYDKVDGLSRSRPVTINGFQVGSVEEIYFHPDGSGRLMVRMNMTNDFAISKGTLARIYSEDLLGGKSIELVLGVESEPAMSGDTLQSDIQLSLTEEVNKQVAPLKQKTEKLIGSVDTVLILISGFLNSETQENFMETFNSIRRSFQMLENTVRTVDETVVESQHDLQTVIRNLASITSNLAENNDELNRAFNNIGNITDSLAQVKFAETFQSLNKALVSAEVIMNKVAEGDGTLGMLINDKELYNNLQEASNQLEILLEDVRYNPKRYVNFSVFGKSESYSREEIIEMEKERKAREDTSRKENSDNSD